MARNNLIDQVRNDQEALVILSALGFVARDWPCIAKVGGALKLLCSDLLSDLFGQNDMVSHTFKDLRLKLDTFYGSSGFLISPLSHPSCRLFRSKQAPLVFFGRHNQRLLEQEPIVAIVGSRLPSLFGLKFTAQLSSTLAHYGICVVSGGAKGIDRAAHDSCLRSGGDTIVIPGNSCDLARDNHIFSDVDLSHIAIVHPFGPSAPQGKYMFVERNRYVAAMADAVVVVQGQEGSGTLHTARFARQQGIALFAVPGALDDKKAFVPNYLLKSGYASVLVDFDQFAQSLVTNADKPPKKRKIMPKERTKNGQKITELPYLLQVINDHENSLGIDELMLLTKKSLGELQKELLDFELSGRILKRGSQFVLTGN